MNGEPQPFLRPLLGAVSPEGYVWHESAAASREAAREQMDRDRALYGTPRRAQSELPQLKEPSLPPDYAAKLAQLDEGILKRGVGLDRDLLHSLGRQKFEQLLEADRKIERSMLGAGLDCTQWQSVQRFLHAFETSAVPARKMSEQATGSGKERDAIRRITGFADLWKASHEQRETLDAIFAFHDLFETLIFGQSAYAVSHTHDGRLRSRFFCGGRGRRVEFLLRDWRSVLTGSLTSVELPDALWHVVSWLSNEHAPLQSKIDLARSWGNVRAPSKAQLLTADAVWRGFLLGLRDFELWQFVGRACRTMIDESRLSAFRKEIALRYRAVTVFHEQLRNCFMRDSGDFRDAHLQFDHARHREFIDRIVQQLLDHASALLALGVEESGGTVIARFQDRVLVDGRHKLADKRASVARQLAAAFFGSSFELEFTS